MITADTITAQQILELERYAISHWDDELLEITSAAFGSDDRRYAARARCAEILNKRSMLAKGTP